jgi:hypothetical protein
MAGGLLFIFAIAATTVNGEAINIGWTLTDSLFSIAN